jgi:hypothetical protein
VAAPLAKRMQVKPGHRILGVNAPSGLRFKAVAEAGRRGERRRPAAAS